jgi:hypothetical protein
VGTGFVLSSFSTARRNHKMSVLVQHGLARGSGPHRDTESRRTGDLNIPCRHRVLVGVAELEGEQIDLVWRHPSCRLSREPKFSPHASMSSSRVGTLGTIANSPDKLVWRTNRTTFSDLRKSSIHQAFGEFVVHTFIVAPQDLGAVRAEAVARLWLTLQKQSSP